MNLETLQSIARLGVRVGPVFKGTKCPAVKSWADFSSDPAQIQDWVLFSRPQDDFALACGEGLDVIDCDTLEAARFFAGKTLAAAGFSFEAEQCTNMGIRGIAAVLWNCLKYPAVITGRRTEDAPEGGLHLYCTSADRGANGRGIDFEGAHYAIDYRSGRQGKAAALANAPGSEHKSGHLYELVTPLPATLADLPAAPGWFLDCLGEQKEYEPTAPLSAADLRIIGGAPASDRQQRRVKGEIEGNIRRAIEELATAPEGGRNQELNRIAYSLGRCSICAPEAAEKAFDDLIAAGAAAGLNRYELKATPSAAYRRGSNNPWIPSDSDPSPLEAEFERQKTARLQQEAELQARLAGSLAPAIAGPAVLQPTAPNQPAEGVSAALEGEQEEEPEAKAEEADGAEGSPLEVVSSAEVKAAVKEALEAIQPHICMPSASALIAQNIASDWLSRAKDYLVIPFGESELKIYHRSPKTAIWGNAENLVKLCIEEALEARFFQPSKGSESAGGEQKKELRPCSSASVDLIFKSLLRRSALFDRQLSYLPKEYEFLEGGFETAEEAAAFEVGRPWFLLPTGQLWSARLKVARPAPANYFSQRFELACLPKPGETPVYEAAYREVGIEGEKLRRLDQMFGLAVFGKGQNLGRAPLFLGPAGVGKSVAKQLIYEATGGLRGCTMKKFSPRRAAESPFAATQSASYRILFIDDRQGELRKAEEDFLDSACGEADVRTFEEKFGALTPRETEQIWFVCANKLPPIGDDGGRAQRRWLAVRASKKPAKKDAFLLQKLKAELPALLWRWNEALEGIEGPEDFPIIEEDAELNSEIAEEGDIISRWYLARFEQDYSSDNYKIPASDLKNDFIGWCFWRKLHCSSKDKQIEMSISREMKERGHRKEKIGKVWYYLGIRLREGQPELTPDGKIIPK